MKRNEINANEIAKEMVLRIWNSGNNGYDACVAFVENNGEYSIKANAFVDDDNVIYRISIDSILESINLSEKFNYALNEDYEMNYEDIAEEDIEELAVTEFADELEAALCA